MKINFSGRFYHAEAYGVNPETFRIDPEIIRQRALETHPAMIIGGWSATAYRRLQGHEGNRRRSRSQVLG